MDKKSYTLNGKKLTEKEFLRARENLTKQGLIIIHEGHEVYRTRILG